MGKVGFGVAVGCAVISCAIAVVFVGRRARSRRRWGRAVDVVREFEEGCAISIRRLRQMVDAMAVEMNAGLASEGGSKLKMLLTYIDSLPDGKEVGTYYSLHLGATNLRVLCVELGGRHSMILRHQLESFPIPSYLTSATTEELFDFIAMTFQNFVERVEGFELTADLRRELGFTLSFPVRQISVSSGFLIGWTKGFEIEDTIGKDVTRCLEEAMSRRGLNFQVAALVNDTVGSLALGHYYDKDTVAAVVIGTGTNACYLERTEAIIKSQGLLTNSGVMAVNMEWGSFWSSHLPRTSYDVSLDEESQNPNDQGFEKMISGMYLGDIVRRVLHRIAKDSDIFGDASCCLADPFMLRTPLMAAMHEDDSPDLAEVARILSESLKMQDVPLRARRIIVWVCDIVARRAARLAAAGIVGILKKLGRDGSSETALGRTEGKSSRTVIAMEGGLYTNYALFREYLNEALMEIVGVEVAQNVVLRTFHNGSGIGAALIAASHPSNQ